MRLMLGDAASRNHSIVALNHRQMNEMNYNVHMQYCHGKCNAIQIIIIQVENQQNFLKRKIDHFEITSKIHDNLDGWCGCTNCNVFVYVSKNTNVVHYIHRHKTPDIHLAKRVATVPSVIVTSDTRAILIGMTEYIRCTHTSQHVQLLYILGRISNRLCQDVISWINKEYLRTYYKTTFFHCISRMR